MNPYKAVKKQIKKSLIGLYHPARPVGTWCENVINNRRNRGTEGKFLVLRHGYMKPGFYNIILDWTARNFPELRGHFELHQTPYMPSDWSGYILHIPWLQDPVQQWSSRAYKHAMTLEAECDRHDIPVINRVSNLINATKHRGSEIMAAAGLRTPNVTPIRDIEKFRDEFACRQSPVVIREDWGHRGEMHYVENKQQLDAINFNRLERPIAVEYIDTRNLTDNLYRKYRYTVIGDVGVEHSLQIKNSWVVRGQDCEKSDVSIDEECCYFKAPDPNGDILKEAAGYLGLDFVSFDYSYTREGEMVVWEANPYPYLHYSGPERNYRNPQTEKILAAIVRMYCERSGLKMDERLFGAFLDKKVA